MDKFVQRPPPTYPGECDYFPPMLQGKQNLIHINQV